MGRSRKGICYRLYTLEMLNKCEKAQRPEIARVNLAQGLLNIIEVRFLLFFLLFFIPLFFTNVITVRV